MKILLVDDEPSARDRLRGLLAEIDPATEIVGEAGEGGEALRLIAKAAPDLVFLDILMPRLDGIATAREISKLAEPPAVVFATAHDDYAVDAFELSAIDYLLKPVRKQRLEAALSKAKRFTGEAWSKLAEALPPECRPARRHLCVYRHGELRLVPLAAVAYFRADNKYTTVRFDEGEALLDDSLVSLEREFGESFIRIHRNALVAVDRVEGLHKLPEGGMGMRLVGVAELLEVSRRHLPGVRERFRQIGGLVP
ncbi:two component transcriptional regulator, LytTR family [Methylomagnum ishizawai]|uniref:Two component transcriptional regulator, LytTR family n=1 Tax=Methylomagnum ishizawai TaxID=1760988 RepID=A0A1Y6D2T8_9GAMM|nr:LytTR family DNA-binding domain-containing protein [Methylomagnum ishizawai]SMF97258.1 two component transcriptional regulator, LytTR family [Methylomagnum ishizawai]